MSSPIDEFFKFKVGTIVRHAMHTRDHSGWQGIITARELYQDFTGAVEEVYYVRWLDPYGKVDSDRLRLSVHEITSEIT